MRIAMESMIHDIADQEQGRKAKRHEHAGSMGFPISVLDEIQPDAERTGAQAIQGRSAAAGRSIAAQVRAEDDADRAARAEMRRQPRSRSG